MKMMLDVDGVLANFIEAYYRVGMDMGLTDHILPVEEQTDWKVDFEDGDLIWKEIDKRTNWWMTLASLVSPAEIEMLNEVIKIHDVFFLTNRHATSVGLSIVKQTMYWLEGIGVHTQHTTTLAVENKGRLCATLGIRVGIDDKPSNCQDLNDWGVKPVVRSWKYNQGMPYKYVNSVAEFLKAYIPMGVLYGGGIRLPHGE